MHLETHKCSDRMECIQLKHVHRVRNRVPRVRVGVHRVRNYVRRIRTSVRVVKNHVRSEELVRLILQSHMAV